jgi:tetratricopeptide (TPR) repeat protein
VVKTAVRLGLGCLLVIATAGLARAQDRDARELEAKKACLGGHADKGIELLADLYAETNDPTYIYNQGRCFEQNGRFTEAVTRFREYLRKATAAAPDERAQLGKHITELESEGHAAAPAVAPSPAAAPAAPVVVVQAPPAEASPARAHHLKILAFVTGGIGVLSVGAGVAMGLRASSLSSEVSNDAKMMMYSQSKFDSGERAQTLEIVGYSVGAAALIASGILYYLAAERGPAASEPAVAVSIGAGGFGTALRMSF